MILCRVCLVLVLASPALLHAQADMISDDLDKAGRQFVLLALSMREQDASYQIDYGGPEELEQIAISNPLTFEEISTQASEIASQLDTLDTSSATNLVRLRHDYIISSLRSLSAVARLRNGHAFTFDEESEAIYGVIAPQQSITEFEQALSQLEQLLPGAAPLHERIEQFEQPFRIPADKLIEAVQATIDECRRRSSKFLDLPENEELSLKSVSNKPWGAYQSYLWNFESIVQVNVDIPFTIDVPITLGCHESYPGHHATAAILEARYFKELQWIEFSILPVFSRAALIHEGTATFAERAVFPGKSRVEFMKNELAPIIGKQSLDFELFEEVREKRQALKYVSIEAARNYLDGKWSKEATREFLEEFWLRPPEAIDNWFAFTEQYRAYRINSVLGEELIDEYVKKRSSQDLSDDSFRILAEILSLPPTPLVFDQENID